MVFRKSRRPTPEFKIPPPYNPIQGEHADLNPEGVNPYCAMVQVAAEDVYEDYVICRGFDPRINKFINYVEGSATQLGMSVAKPYGSRIIGKYNIGEVYAALLPIQGTSISTSPSPSGVGFRLGQNPGVAGNAINGGHPESLSDSVGILYDHNGKVVNWTLVQQSADLVTKKVVPIQDVQPGDSVACKVWEGQPPAETSETIQQVWLDWEHGDQKISAGKEARAIYEDGDWRFISAECEDDEADLEPTTKIGSGTSLPSEPTTYSVFLLFDGAGGYTVYENDGAGGLDSVSETAPPP